MGVVRTFEIRWRTPSGPGATTRQFWLYSLVQVPLQLGRSLTGIRARPVQAHPGDGPS